MSLEIWPPVAAPELKLKVAATQERELEWVVNETVDVCRELKHGLDDCYALLAPIDPGSTLVMSTPRNERVKGTITRVGTRIVKGSLNIQLRTIPAQTLALSPSNPLHLQALDAVHTRLTQAIDLLAVTLSRPQDPHGLASTLDLLADAISESAALLKGPPLTETDPTWQSGSCPARHFSPPLGPNISVHIGLQESCIVLWLRALEPVDAPVHLGMKLGLAFGTFRRLEHDEMDTVFKYNPKGAETGSGAGSARHTPDPAAERRLESEPEQMEDVYVREKVRVDSADPSLISLYSKLGFLSHMLGQTRKNLAAVMGAEPDE